MDEKIKTWTLRFPVKESPNMEKALFDWPIVLQYDVKAKDPLISRKLSGIPKATRVCIRSINQSSHSISIRLLFLFCSHVFISRSYENRSSKVYQQKQSQSDIAFHFKNSLIIHKENAKEPNV